MSPLFGVFYEPGKVFESLPGRKKAWVIPMILDVLLLIAITAVVPRYIGRENLLRQQMETFHLSAENMQKVLENASKPAAIYRGYVFTAIGTCLILLMIAAALLGFSMMTSRPAKFGTMLSMVSISYFPYWLVTALMTTLILVASPDPTTLDSKNLVATNLGAYMNKDTMSKGLYSLMTSIDILSFAEIFLLSLGFSKLTRSNLFFGFAAVGGLWVLYVAVKMGISLLF
jgi:hypothetical protein